MNWKKDIFSFITKSRKRFGRISHWITFLDNAVSNRNNDHLTNGEFWLQEKMSNIGVEVIFDVGSNIGNWSKRIATLSPLSRIYAFEPILETFQNFENNISSFSNIVAVPCGLSDLSTQSIFYSNTSNSIFSSKFNRLDMKSSNNKEIKVDLITGAEFCIQKGISKIDFLKIDVEGLEFQVLKGFLDFIENQKIKVVQFEYGPMNIESRTFLKDFYDFLGPKGYQIGKLYPDGVEFCEYCYQLDDFKWANYVAVLHSEKQIIDKISV